ncbi:MAG: DUF4054 domain-containing protein [Synergistaceae bacterium]|jgi:hypothetical protein|nr:DUF4054 domain-containing protein [Synergistaceae bacterium]
MIGVEGFRSAVPAFANVNDYPDARVQFWLNLAQKMLSGARWGSIYEEGVYLYAAHYLTVEGVAGSASGDGGSGAVSSESQSIGDTSFSVTYDTSGYAGAGQMASTKYGQQYLDLVRIIGAGGVQL